MDTADFSDAPINLPAHDAYGIDPFAVALAKSVLRMKSPEGTVIGLHGAWGSGKSSAINLILHHLSDSIEAENLKVVRFNPWWFRGEEALVIAFFRELYAATSPSLGSKIGKVIPKLGARLLKAGSMVGAAADMAGAGGAGKIASGAMDWLADLVEGQGEGVEKLHGQLSDALRSDSTRYLIVIDDIDRLSPDEALAMFRMVKSAGRLPQVIYLLAFDRTLAEKVVAERYPSEGPHYLEKIVQASFELPAPSQSDLANQTLMNIERISGPADESRVLHIMNQFYDLVAPELKTPRDVFRFGSALAVTWPAVEGEVDLGDFLAIEALRLFRPHIYRALRAAPNEVCGATGGDFQLRNDDNRARMDRLLLSHENEEDKQRLRQGLMRMFPRLAGVWSNVYSTSTRGWDQDRRACSAEHFPAYFQLAPGPDVLPGRELRDLLENVGNEQFISDILRSATLVPKRTRGTKASLILDALTHHADSIGLEDARPLLAGVFTVADEIDVEQDEQRGFSIGSNPLRIHWLLRALLRNRTSLADRSAILMDAMQGAPLNWLIDFSGSAWRDYHPSEGREPSSEDECLVTSDAAEALRARCRERIEAGANDGTLIEQRHLARALYSWTDVAGQEVVTQWSANALEDNHQIARLADAFTSESWTQGMGFHGMGDHVAIRSDRASVAHLDSILDVARFRTRISALAADPTGLSEQDAASIKRFHSAWSRAEPGDG